MFRSMKSSPNRFCFHPLFSEVGVSGFFAAILLLAPVPAGAVDEMVRLFNGKDYDAFYTFLRGFGRDKNPDQVFSVKDGLLRITGQHWGCLTTKEEYGDYKLVAEFKWGEKTWGDRAKAARDCGILIHSIGEDGAYSGVWMYSIEIQIIEGGTGDFIIVGDKSERFSMTVEAAPEKQKGCYVFEPGGKKVTVNTGRINWWGRDPEWKDVLGFRGKKDVEKPAGEWNKLVCLVDGDGIEVFLNDVLVNRATKVRPNKGRIQIQSEGAEIFFRRVDLYPMEKDR